MSETNERGRHMQAEPLSAPILFWGLMALGACGLAPAVLLPHWRAYEAMCVAEQREAHRREQMERAVSAERRLLDGLRTDPALLRRVAQRDLSVKPTDGEIVAVGAEAPVADRIEEEFTPQPVPPPEWTRAVLARLPVLEYDAVFCEPATRSVVIALSLGVMCAGLLLYGRARRSIGAPGEDSSP